MTRGFQLTGTPFRARNQQALADLPRRMRRLHKALAYQSAFLLQGALAVTMAGILDADRYADAMVLRRLPGRAPGFGVYPQARAKRAEDLPADRSVVYVRPRGKLDPRVTILAKHSPWPLGEMPWTPPKHLATLTYRKVTPVEARRVSQLRRDDSSAWKVALQQLGVRPESAPPPADTSLQPDLYFQALRLEFGGAASKSHPHWRPALRLVAAQLRMWFRQNARRILTMRASKYRVLIPRVPGVAAQRAAATEAFVARLGRVM